MIAAPSPAALRPIDRPTWVVLAILVALAVWLRAWRVGDSLWVDELHTAWVVADGLGPLSARAALGNQQPLYFLAPWLTTQLWGLTEWGLRAPSLVAGAALPLVLFGWVRRWTDQPRAALVAAAVAACDPTLVWYGGEARGYALVQLGAAVQLGLWIECCRAPTRARRLGHVLVTAGLFYLHYTTALLLAGAAALWAVGRVAAWRSPRSASLVSGEYRPRDLALDLSAVVLLCLPTLPHVAATFARRGDWALFVPQRDAWTVASEFALGLYVLAPLAIWSLDAATRRHRGAVGDGSPLLAAGLLAWLAAPLVIAWQATTHDIARLLFYRYLAGLAAAPPCLAALAVAGSRRSLARWSVAAVAIGGAVWLLAPRLERPHAGENWRDAVARLHELDPAGGRLLLVESGLIEASAERLADQRWREFALLPISGAYRAPQSADHRLPLASVGLDAFTDDDLVRLRAAGEGRLLVRRPPTSVGPRLERLARALRRQRVVVEFDPPENFGGVSLVRWRIVTITQR